VTKTEADFVIVKQPSKTEAKKLKQPSSFDVH